MPQSEPVCRVLSAGEPFVGKQGFTYAPAVSAETVKSLGIYMQLLTIPAGGRAKAHKHELHETAIYVLSGEGRMWWGERLEHHLVSRAGEFVYIPANVPHLPYNPSATETCIAGSRAHRPQGTGGVVLFAGARRHPPPEGVTATSGRRRRRSRPSPIAQKRSTGSFRLYQKVWSLHFDC